MQAATIQAWYGGYYPSEDSDYSSFTEPDPEPYKADPALQSDPSPINRPPGVGLVLGRFDPLHQGHEFLLRFAQQMSTSLVIGINAQKESAIPWEVRKEWLEELFPQARVVCLESIRKRELESKVGSISCVYTSEVAAQMTTLARNLGADLYCLDKERLSVPVRASQIRGKPFTHWNYLPACVRAHFARRVALVGPESVGKTTLAKALAEHYKTAWVQEQAARLAEERGGKLRLEDFPWLARAQRSAEDGLARLAQRVLICDSDVYNLGSWSQRLFAQGCPSIDHLARAGRYDMHLLLLPRASGQFAQCQAFVENLSQALIRDGRPYCLLSGDVNTMKAKAIEAVETLLLEPLIPTSPAHNEPGRPQGESRG